MMKAGIVVGLLLAGHAALACSAASCADPQPVPRDGKTIPANAPALVVHDGRDEGTAASTQVVVVAADGTRATPAWAQDPVESNAYLAPVPAQGTYQYESPQPCYGVIDGGVRTRLSAFTVGPPAPLPQTLGAVQPTYSRGLEKVRSSRGSCTYERDVAAVDLVPDAMELAAFADVMRYSLSIDGTVWGTTNYGDDPLLELAADAVPRTGPHSPKHVFTVCDHKSQDAEDDHGIAAGKHHAVLTAHLAGASSDPPPIEIDFELRCDATPSAGSTTWAAHGCDLAQHGSLLSPAALLLIAVVWKLRRRAQA